MMSIIFRTALSTRRFSVAPSFHKTLQCLLFNQRHYAISSYKYASTATFPGLISKYPYINNHDDLHKFSVENPEIFWDFQAQDLLTWSKPYSSNKIMKCNMEHGHFKWFEDGQINASINCVDR